MIAGLFWVRLLGKRLDRVPLALRARQPSQAACPHCTNLDTLTLVVRGEVRVLGRAWQTQRSSTSTAPWSTPDYQHALAWYRALARPSA